MISEARANTGVVKCVAISPCQAAHMVQFLDALISQGSNLSVHLESVRDKFADAAFLATWLRSDVRVDLDTEDMIELSQALCCLEHADNIAASIHQDFLQVFNKNVREICPPQNLASDSRSTVATM